MSKLTIEEVEEKIRKNHGDIVVLDSSTYTKTCAIARFIDKDYGEFWARADGIIYGNRAHPKRGRSRIGKTGTIPIDVVVQRISDVHGDIVVLDESTYANTQIKAKFIDKDYGEFWACPYKIFAGGQHRNRANAIAAKKLIIPIGVVEKRIKEIHGKIVKIDQSTYVDVRTKSRFIDKDYGEFWMTPNNLFSGQGHRERGHEKRKSTLVNEYGVDNSLKSNIVREKIKQTNLERYGCGNVFQNLEIREKIKNTNIRKYGCQYPAQNQKIALKMAKAQNNSYILHHWKTNEELICQASWEKAVVEYFNKNKIDFIWQKAIFHLPTGKTYRPDCYLFSINKWVEIKGYFRKDAKEKWDWFHNKYQSELWNKDVLKQMDIL